MQWGLFDKQLGRSDAEEADPEGRVPQWEKASVEEIKNKFIALGFGPRQVNYKIIRCNYVISIEFLACSIHLNFKLYCLVFQVAVMSAFFGPDQLATEALLAADPQVQPWVQKYQRSRETVSQTDYEVSVVHF